MARRRARALIAGHAVWALCLWGFSSPTEAAEARGGRGTLGPTRPSQLVNAQTGTTDCPGGFAGGRRVDRRLLSDGTTATLVVPDGQVFVITAAQFRLTDSAASQTFTVRLGIPCGVGCMRPIVDVHVLTDTGGVGGTNLSLPHGIAVKPSVVLCVADASADSPDVFVSLQGYFTSDR